MGKHLTPYAYAAPHRKPVLLTFAYLGAISSILFFAIPSSSPLWPLIGLLACGANVGFGVSVVAMNSYLPNLARETLEVREALADLRVAGGTQEAVDALAGLGDQQEQLPGVDDGIHSSGDPSADPEIVAEKAYHAAIARSTSRISAFGIALGYLAGVVLLILTIIPVSRLQSSTFSLRLAIGLTGIWWAVLSVPAGFWLPSSKSLTLVEGAEIRTHDAKRWTWTGEVQAAWIRLARMLHWTEIKRLRNTFWYLAAWFLLSDGKLV